MPDAYIFFLNLVAIRVSPGISASSLHCFFSRFCSALLSSGAQGDTNWDIAQSELASRGFELQGSYLDSLLFATPQSRKRFYVLGVRSAGLQREGETCRECTRKFLNFDITSVSAFLGQ